MTVKPSKTGVLFIVMAYILPQNPQGSIDQETVINRPGSQHNLREEGANYKHQERVPRSSRASVFTKTSEWWYNLQPAK